MSAQKTKIKSFFNLKRILIPVGLGLGVVLFFVFRDFDKESLNELEWHGESLYWLFLSLLLMAGRDIAYMYRIRILTDKELSWRQAFDVIMLWEFSSSVTPTQVGGTAVALYIVNKEGISMGKTTSVVLTSAMLDELFFLIFAPIIFLLVGGSELFKGQGTVFGMEFGMRQVFYIGYSILLLFTLFILYGIFINPKKLKDTLLFFTKLPFLKKFREKALETGDDIITTSREMRTKSFGFWFKAFFATIVSWTSRYWVVNTMLMAFFAVSDHFLVYARQLIMWVILLVSPTPGSSGVAEFSFSTLLGDIIPGEASTAFALALLWRLISYYPYLLIGVIIIPGWLRKVYKKKK
jgi:uncharacterized protein (TIRG00374 family)